MDIKLDQILFQIINFGVVVGAVTYFLYKPVGKILDERALKVSHAQKAADESLSERQQIESLKKKAKSEAEKEAAAIIEKAKAQADELIKTMKSDAKTQLAEDRKRIEDLWAQEHTSVLNSIESKFSTTVTTVAAKLIGESVDQKKHEKLISEGLKQLSSSM